MKKANKVNIKTGFRWLYVPLFIILTYCINTFAAPKGYFFISSNSLQTDSPPKKKRGVRVPAALPATTNTIVQQPPTNTYTTKDKIGDTVVEIHIDTLPIKISKDTLTAPVVYHADDSMVLDVPGKKMYLYGKVSRVNYEDNDLSAPSIEYDQKTGLVKAVLVKDSTGKVIAYPQFNQGDFKTKSDTIIFNMATRRGITKGTYTQQGEMYVYGEKIKKTSDKVFYALNGRFTTCDLDTPHFAFVSPKIKFINKEMAYTGAVHPEFEGVPLPPVLPFGIFPLKQGRHSGLLPPSFNANDQLGISLENLGYYKVFNDNWDVITRGTIYSYGSWKFNLNPRYFKRYRYQGNLSFDIQRIRPLDSKANQSINISWSHNSDNKARPGVSFRAMVNAGSSKHNSLVPNSPYRNVQNQLFSTISYSKNWKNKPYNFSIDLKHNQNTLTKYLEISFPNLTFNLNTLYPFRRKEPVGEYKWYENLGVGLNSIAIGRTSFYDTANSVVRQMLKNYSYGISHSVPIQLSLPPLGPLQVSPGISYSEWWYQKKLEKQWNAADKKVDTISEKNGLFTARQMSFNLSLSTRIFGLFGFPKKSRIQGIRHQITPNITASFSPNMARKHYYNVQIDTFGTIVPMSYYANNIISAPGFGKSGTLSFSLGNNLAMKVRSKKDTSAEGIKKVSIIDNLGINTSYDFMLDSFRMAPISINASTNLFQKLSINGGASFSPYQVGDKGSRIDKLVWAQKPLTLGKLTNANLSLSTSLNGGKKKAGGNSAKSLGDISTYRDPNGMPLNEYETEAAYIQNNPGEFVDFNIPWDLSLAYTFSYNNNVYYYPPQKYVSQSINLNGSMNLTEKWKLGGSTSYNISTKELGIVSMYLSRDLHCWQMSINVSPVGTYRFFSINISPKSSILRDLKINRTRSYYDPL